MNNFTFLTDEQIFGTDKLNIFKKYGEQSTITDYAILLGGYAISNDYINDEKNLKSRTGWWWTSTLIGTKLVCVVTGSGGSSWSDVTNFSVGARPAIPYSSISFFCSNVVRGVDGVEKVDFGEYPQTVLSEDISKLFEQAYVQKTLKQVDCVHSFNLACSEDSSIDVPVICHDMYELNGKKAIRFVADWRNNGAEVKLSDGRRIIPGKEYWIAVEPITWLVDEEKDVALVEKLVFSGVPFHQVRNYKDDFEQTIIKRFMDQFFSKEIFSSSHLIQIIQIAKGMDKVRKMRL